MTTLNRNDQLGRTNSPWSAALKVLCSILAITGSAWPNQAGSLRADFDTAFASSSREGATDEPREGLPGVDCSAYSST